MAGTIFGLGLSQQTDARGVPLIGALLYIYAANTSTPSTIYSNFGLTATHPWPLTADSAGRLPAFWLADGSYRVRLTTSAGVEIFDEQSITAIGSSSSGSSSTSQDTTTLLQTGHIHWEPITGTKSGFVRCNGRTIGSGASSGTERANSDCQSLFEYLWNNVSDTYAPVSGGRGATATADFNANKAIGLPDLRSKTLFGLDDMGNSSAGITGASSTALAPIGASTYTISQANLPNVTFGSSALTATMDVRHRTTLVSLSNGTDSIVLSITSTGVSTAAGAVIGTTGSISGGVPSGGSGTHLAILSPARVGTWYIKL